MISTGMATLDEIIEAIKAATECTKIIKNWGEKTDLTLFHCNSRYPAPAQGCHTQWIGRLKEFFPDIPIGWSDHTKKPGVIYSAIANGAKVIEFHIDLNDKAGQESKIGHCWTQDEIRRVIGQVNVWKNAEGCNPYDSNYNLDTLLRIQRTNPKDGKRGL